MELKDLDQLMIGNYILEGGKPTLLDRNLFYNILKYWHKVKDNYGLIPLTINLVKNLGFKQQEIATGEYHLTEGMSTLELCFNVDEFTVIIHQYDEENDIHDRVILHKDISNLNQLQNLFYSLTGIQLMDIVAYNYYKTMCEKKDWFVFTFEDYFLRKGEKTNSVSGYRLGDLPQNLF